MVSENDIHRLAGHLYLATLSDDIDVVQGERVLDRATGTKRDVDVVVLTSGKVALAGVEVKDHTQRLDVTDVEQLCQKLNDMPDLKAKQIVSRSGFTAPALRKASHHAIDCFTLKEGPLPSFSNIDLSLLSEVDVFERKWMAAELLFLPAEGTRPDLVQRVANQALIPALPSRSRERRSRSESFSPEYCKACSTAFRRETPQKRSPSMLCLGLTPHLN